MGGISIAKSSPGPRALDDLSVLRTKGRETDINQVRVLLRPKPLRAAIVLMGNLKPDHDPCMLDSLLTSRPQPPAVPGVDKVHSNTRAFALLAHWA